jgi:hypothetical protein
LRVIFIIWLVVILYSLSRVGPMFARGDIGGWAGQTVGFALPLFGIYYLVRWIRTKRNTSKQHQSS